jgi:hypothetical protein
MMSRIVRGGERELMRATLAQVRSEVLRAWAAELEKRSEKSRSKLLRELEREVRRIVRARLPGLHALF